VPEPHSCVKLLVVRAIRSAALQYHLNRRPKFLFFKVAQDSRLLLLEELESIALDTRLRASTFRLQAHSCLRKVFEGRQWFT